MLIYPNKLLSTKLVFDNFDFRKEINSNPMYFNKLEFIIFKSVSQSIEPEIKNIIKISEYFKKIIAFGMSGSGSCCFIFQNSS